MSGPASIRHGSTPGPLSPAHGCAAPATASGCGARLPMPCSQTTLLALRRAPERCRAQWSSSPRERRQGTFESYATVLRTRLSSPIRPAVTQHQDPTFLTFEQIDAILEQSVDEILRHEDPQQYFAWMRGKAPEFFGHLPFIDKSGPAAIAAAAARSIWNATPLPGHQFRPRPLPPPERNAPCPCGSGVKYKHCCAGLPDLDMGHTEDLWPWVIRRLTPSTLNAALEHRRIPGWALAAVARLHLEQGHNRKAAELLEPLFAGELARLDGRFEEALDVLCDAYLDLGYEHKRMALLERVAEKGGKELARAAHERMASMLFDRGERDAAWESFRRAQRADPDNPSLVLNEITLLVAEHRFEEASGSGPLLGGQAAQERAGLRRAHRGARGDGTRPGARRGRQLPGGGGPRCGAAAQMDREPAPASAAGLHAVGARADRLVQPRARTRASEPGSRADGHPAGGAGKSRAPADGGPEASGEAGPPRSEADGADRGRARFRRRHRRRRTRPARAACWRPSVCGSSRRSGAVCSLPRSQT